MVESLSQRVVGRMAAVLFVVAGCVSLEDTLTPTGVRFLPSANRAVVALIAISRAFGAGSRRGNDGRLGAPSGSRPRGSRCSASPRRSAPITPTRMPRTSWWSTRGSGCLQPRGTSLKVLPVAAAAYVLPLAFRGEPADALLSGGEVMVICAAVGEALAVGLVAPAGGRAARRLAHVGDAGTPASR